MTRADSRSLGAAIARLEAGADPSSALAGLAGTAGTAGGDVASGAGAGADSARAAVAAAAHLSAETGAPLASTLRLVAAEQARRERAAAGRDAALEGVVASARVLAALPWVGVAMAVALEPATIDLLTGTPLGWAMIAAGVGLAMAGRRWLSRMSIRAAAAGEERVPACLALALAEAALATGLAIPTAVGAVGAALGRDGAALSAVARDLRAGEPWTRAWQHAGEDWAPLRRALEPGWWEGAAPGPALAAEREAEARDLDAAAARAAARLEVQSALPLALCLLPAFVVTGVLPLVLAVAGAARAG